MIYFKKISFSVFLIVYFFYYPIVLANQSTHKIEVLVNDNIITNYDIAQYFAINSIIENITVTNENGDFLYNKTINNLIDMKLQQAKIKEYEIKIDEGNNSYYENYFFQSRGLDKNRIYAIIEKNNLDINVLRERINTSILWEQLTTGLFLHTISISETEINELLKIDSSLTPELAKRVLTNKQVQLKSNKYLRDLKAEANIERR